MPKPRSPIDLFDPQPITTQGEQDAPAVEATAETAARPTAGIRVKAADVKRVTSYRLPEVLAARIVKRARKLDVPVSLLATVALEELLARDDEDLRPAIDRESAVWNRPRSRRNR